ncbi:hypothetical protein AC579_8709 [Pseudocercospora musae]|uniref:Uncharacterized protein n=1 Tax=Pseudocercospora musae TaxID=113226 RepID=A0A139IW65_9PEZI|nr:hypothetical protein AC579_8709 [Pseudocercospora musae]
MACFACPRHACLPIELAQVHHKYLSMHWGIWMLGLEPFENEMTLVNSVATFVVDQNRQLLQRVVLWGFCIRVPWHFGLQCEWDALFL